MKPEILVLVSILESFHEELGEEYTVRYPGVAGDRNAFIGEVAGNIRAVITNGTTGIDAALIDALPKLEMIACFSVGYENVDLAAARARGLAVTKGRGANSASAADLALALMLAVTRGVVARDRLLRAGRWPEARRLAPTISDKRLGIVGLGQVGAAIAARAAGFGMEIAYHNRRPRPDAPYRFVDSVTDLAAQSDYVVTSCPGGAETRHLIDRKVLAALGPEGYLINIARGSVVDTEALIAALDDGAIAGAGLDVFEDEPAVPESLIAMDHVVLTPHVGGFTREAFRAGFDQMRENLRAHFSGASLITPIANE